MDYDNIILRLTEEHGPSREAPASYWLGRWRNHTAAEAQALREDNDNLEAQVKRLSEVTNG
mgnify:CR=1 FL=1